MSYNKITSINTESAPAPVGPYNQAIRAGEWLYCSGQIALCPTNGRIIGNGSVKEETQQVIKNLKNVLSAAGAKTNNVVKTTIYLVNLEDFEVVNSIYSETFQSNDLPSPARACVEVAALPKGALVEIDCVAWLGQN